ncbi:MAG: IS66 family insertion sequence element accessory protein TnpB [Eubacteriales bacterium]|nr:IS66 family insertion sequence element accessory protein TnpB [Eubacteriales bacterium]
MSSKTSLVASNVRLQEWALMVQACQHRPAEMDIQTWCSEQGISKHAYYYRLRKVREAMLDVIDAADNAAPGFVELKQPCVPSPSASMSDKVVPEICASVRFGEHDLLITNAASTQFLRNLKEAMASC